MEAYTGFAEVYDMFMDNIPYQEWSEYIVSLLKEYGVEEGIVLELGCGTGTITELLSIQGYDMIGVDNSADMLNQAMEKRSKSGRNILYLKQDMREFELYGTVRAAVCVCDSLNYLLEYEDLVKTFRLVNNYLDPDGLFLFDLNTVYKYKTLLGEQTIAENREEGSFIWENFYEEQEQINEYVLTLYIKGQEGLYRRYEEVHYQRAYETDVVKRALEEAGLTLVTVLDAFTQQPQRADSERVYFIARECGKSKDR